MDLRHAHHRRADLCVWCLLPGGSTRLVSFHAREWGRGACVPNYQQLSTKHRACFRLLTYFPDCSQGHVAIQAVKMFTRNWVQTKFEAWDGLFFVSGGFLGLECDGASTDPAVCTPTKQSDQGPKVNNVVMSWAVKSLSCRPIWIFVRRVTTCNRYKGA